MFRPLHLESSVVYVKFGELEPVRDMFKNVLQHFLLYRAIAKLPFNFISTCLCLEVVVVFLSQYLSRNNC